MKNNLLFCAKSLLFSYVVSGLLLMLLAFILYKFHLSDKTIAFFVTLLYITSTLFCGYITGKKMKTRKFLWGFGMGASYFFILFLLSILVHQSLLGTSSNFFLVFMICSGSGMLGGMLS